MPKLVLTVFALAAVASIGNAHNVMEPLLKTSLRRDPVDTRSDQVVSLQQMDMQNYASHKEILDVAVAGGNMAYVAKGPPPVTISLKDPEVKAEVIEMENHAIAEVKEIKNLDSKIDVPELVHEVGVEMEKEFTSGEGISLQKVIADVKANVESVKEVDDDQVAEAVKVVVATVKADAGEIGEAALEASGCDGQARFDILMCNSHMCTDCVLEYCMEKCQKIQKDFPTCRCADWPESRSSYSTGAFASKGQYGDAGDYSKGSRRFL